MAGGGGEQIGLVVKASIEGRKRDLENLAEKTAKSVQKGVRKGMTVDKKALQTMVPPGLFKATQNIRQLTKGLRLPSLRLPRRSAPASEGTLFKGGANADEAGLLGANPGGGAGGGLGLGGGLGGMLGTFAAGMVVFQGIASGVSKMVGLLSEATPSLRNQLKILQFGFMQIIRPMGMALTLILKPIGMFFRVVGREIMKRFKAARDSLKAQGYSGAELGMRSLTELPGIYIDVMSEQLEKVDWSGMFAAIGETLWDLLTEKFPSFLEKLNSTGGLILLALMAAIFTAGALATLATFGALLVAQSLMGMMGASSLLALGGLGLALAPLILGAIAIGLWVLTPIGQDIYDLILGRVNSDKGYVNTVDSGGNKTTVDSNGAGGPAIDTSGMTGDTKINDSLHQSGSGDNLFEQAYNAMGYSGNWDPTPGKDSIIEKIYNKLSGKSSAATGAEVMSTGLVNAHAGEIIHDKGDLRSYITEAVTAAVAAVGGGNEKITLEIPGKALADAIDRRANVQVDLYLKNSIRARRA